MSLDYLSVREASNLLTAKKISAVELTKHYLTRIKELNSNLNAYLTVDEDFALEAAAKSDERRSKNQSLGPLDGVPGAIKDVIATKDVRTTAASKILDQFKPPYNAFVTKVLSDAGTVTLGKTNLDEFAMGASTEYSAYGPSKNPWDTSRVPGGSSGGSAVAVAADLAPFALGTDTGGSIRQPAGWTGVVGMRPTYGRVSRSGVIAMASSFDQVGVFTRSVGDAAILLTELSKYDSGDSTHSNDKNNNFTSSIGQNIKGKKVGVIKEFFDSGLDENIDQAVNEAIDELKRLGAEVKMVSLPLLKYSLAAYYIMVPAEVSTNMERYDGIRYGHSSINTDPNDSLIEVYGKSRDQGFGAEVKRRIILGSYVLSAGYYDQYYAKAQRVRGLIQKQFKSAFKEVDVLVGPVSPTLPFKFGESTSDPLKMYLADVLTVPVNVAGLPGISIPCGFSDGLPIGLQIIADQFREDNIFSVASAFEASTDWSRKHPSLEVNNG